ncbi:MAG: protein TolQ [Burkholderiales bacterium]|jgi:biopolymer transport protein TolQ
MTPADISIPHLIMQATLVVQLVMAGLVLLSLMSWTIIFRKGFALGSTKTQTAEFEQEFWSGADLTQLYQRVYGARDEHGALARIFEAGFAEFIKLRQQRSAGLETSAMLDGVRRAMRASHQRELDALEKNLPFLASVGSVSPYIGLFGTVWGIMHAFVGLSNVQQATLATVAPGIAEALIATAIGLFAAIPAVVAYNRYASEIDRVANRFDNFIEEFSNILQRQAR